MILAKDYDDKGNLIYSEDHSGYKEWYKYDESNRLVQFRDSNGYEFSQEYTNDKLSHYKNSNGFEMWYTYDDKGRLINYKNSVGTNESYAYEGTDYAGSIIERHNQTQLHTHGRN